MIAHNSVANAETQACAFADFFSCEEGIKNPLGMHDTSAVVANNDLAEAVALFGGDLDASWPAGFEHRIIGIVQNIEQDLLQLIGISPNGSQGFLQFFYYLNPMIGKI